MASRGTSARIVSGIVDKIQNAVDIQKNARKKYCMPTKSVVA